MILCENLVKIYSLAGMEVVALQGLDLTVQDGEMLGIVGASGSGKSTLLNVLGGLDRPSAGRALVADRDLLKMNNAELDVYRRTQVGFVWQQTTRNLVPYLNAVENVELPMRLKFTLPWVRYRRARELLDVLGLSQRLKHRPAQLSGGEQQRVAIAVALANNPHILLADEPTGEVDTATALEIYTALRQVNQAYGMTILIVSHDQDIARHTDRVVAIRDGKTSTETVRAIVPGAEQHTDGEQRDKAVMGEGASQTGSAHHAHFEELIVLDSAGRLQVPSDYLEALNIGDRVRVELQEDHLEIRPVAGRGRAAAADISLPSPDDLYVEEDAAPDAKRAPQSRRAPETGHPGLFARLRRSKEK